MKFLVVILLCTISLSGCRHEMYIDDPELEKIFGKWELVESCCGDGSSYYSPSFSGYTQYIDLTKKGILKQYKNDSLQSKIDYWIVREFDKYRNDFIYLLNYDLLISQEIKFVGSDTLYLIDRCWDCFWHIYVRKK